MLLLLSLLAAAGHALSTLELRTSETHRIAVDAFYRADGALQEFLGGARGVPEPTRIVPLAGGHVALSSRPLLRLPAGERLFRVVSRATLAPPGGGAVRRAVGTVVVAGPSVRPPGALLLLGTLQVEGGSSRVDGRDDAGASGCSPSEPVTGLAVLADAPPPLPAELAVDGSPPVLLLDDLAEARRASGIDWAALLGAHGPEPTATVPGEPWPDAGSGGGDAHAWPVVRIEGDGRLDATHAGRGAILVTGDLELADGFAWEGLVLVGGDLRLAGPATVRGGTAAGLRALTGGEPGRAVISGGGADLRFHSCHAAAAAAALGLPPAARPGAWFEEMESWF